MVTTHFIRASTPTLPVTGSGLTEFIISCETMSIGQVIKAKFGSDCDDRIVHTQALQSCFHSLVGHDGGCSGRAIGFIRSGNTRGINRRPSYPVGGFLLFNAISSASDIRKDESKVHPRKIEARPHILKAST